MAQRVNSVHTIELILSHSGPIYIHHQSVTYGDENNENTYAYKTHQSIFILGTGPHAEPCRIHTSGLPIRLHTNCKLSSRKPMHAGKLIERPMGICVGAELHLPMNLLVLS